MNQRGQYSIQLVFGLMVVLFALSVAVSQTIISNQTNSFIKEEWLRENECWALSNNLTKLGLLQGGELLQTFKYDWTVYANGSVQTMYNDELIACKHFAKMNADKVITPGNYALRNSNGIMTIETAPVGGCVGGGLIGHC